MGGKRIHTEFEREVVERLERIEKRLEHAGLILPCLSDEIVREYPDRQLQPQNWKLLYFEHPKEGDERTVDLDGNTLSYRRAADPPTLDLAPDPRDIPAPRPTVVPDDLESYGYLDDPA